MNKLAAIILAAGMSSRMVSFKPMLEIGGMTLTDRLVTIYQQNNLDIILVTGWKHKELKVSFENRNIISAYNPDFQQGMFTSVEIGVKALSDRYSAFFIHPVDIPLVRPYTIKLLLAAHEKQSDKIIYPTYRGKRGHPSIVPTALTPRILGDKPKGGLKDVLDAFPELALEVKTADHYILKDVDTQQDFQELLADFIKYDIPTPGECEVILSDFFQVPEEIRKHGLKVAETAITIAIALMAKGIIIDLDEVKASAQLHDLAKGQRQHSEAGRDLLYELGFKRAGDIVAVHTDLPRWVADWESKIVYLADKFVKGTTIVTLEQRYSTIDRSFEVTPEIVSRISLRRKRAEEIQEEFETILGSSLKELLL